MRVLRRLIATRFTLWRTTLSSLGPSILTFTTHTSRTNMRRMQCDTYPPFKSFGLCDRISDLSLSNTAASSTHEKIQVSLETSVKDSPETTWLDERKSPHGQIAQDEALQRDFDCCTMTDVQWLMDHRGHVRYHYMPKDMPRNAAAVYLHPISTTPRK
jgi:hypothetical protein